MKIPESCNHWIGYQRTRKLPFDQELSEEYQKMKPFLPKELKSVLDIGCGIGGIDYFLSRNHGSPVLHMLDYNKEDENIHFGLRPTASKYNSLESTREFLNNNGITNFVLHDASKGFPTDNEYDLIISLLSCGYHYPVNTYLNGIIKTLSKNGALIIDIRIGSLDFQMLKTIFKTVIVICTENKARRVIARGLI